MELVRCNLYVFEQFAFAPVMDLFRGGSSCLFFSNNRISNFCVIRIIRIQTKSSTAKKSQVFLRDQIGFDDSFPS